MNHLKSILDSVLKKTPTYEKAQTKLRVLEIWPQIVGEKLATRCWAVAFYEDGTLLVSSQSSAWMNSLKYLEPQILEKYEKILGDKQVLKIRFKSGTHESP